jgi:hypothetical protein
MQQPWKHSASRLLLAASLLLACHAQAAPTAVVFPRPETDTDVRSLYPARLLQLALNRSGRAYKVQLSSLRMPQGRGILRLSNGEGVDIVCYMTSAEREANLLPIRIPVDKGLIGWRLLLVNKANAAGLGDIDRIKSLTAGQGSDWPDTAILRANGFKVYATMTYESLFIMLANRRIDYFPRSVSEIWQEADQHGAELAVAPGIALRYPSATYFFVRKGDTQLAADVTAGLERMIADGSFDKLFQQFYGELIRRSGLQNRRIIDLHNPMLPDGVPAARKSLLYHG